MSEWHGYILMELTITLTAQQKINVRDALRSLANTVGNQPDRIMSFRLALGNNKLIAECYFPNGRPTRAQFVSALATEMGLSTNTVSNALTLTVYAPNGTHAESNVACLVYLDANANLWETAPG